MAFIKFNKDELVNLSYSLKREIISANKTGAYCNTSIVCCNTRKYHALLALPVDEFLGEQHVLLSSIDESILVEGKQFNLGIHRYGDVYEPRGHKYIVDFEADPLPRVTYKVGDVKISKTLVLAENKDQLLIRYTVHSSPSKISLSLKPFLAFRNIHSLTKENNIADTNFASAVNGRSYCMYAGFPRLFLQLNKASGLSIDDEGHWYKGLTYSDEQRRGFESVEDLYVPAVFNIELKEGESLIFSASTQEEKPVSMKRTFNLEEKKSMEIKDYEQQLLHCADLLVRDRNAHKMINSGFSWLYPGQMRATLYSLTGLTLYANGDKKLFEEILDNLIADNQERFFRKTKHVEAPLRLADVLQEYIAFGAKAKSVWNKYGDTVKKVIESYAPAKREEISLQPNGLLWAQKDGIALSWMDAYIDGRPVTAREGFQVETNAFWYNSLCFAIDMEKKYGQKDSPFVLEWSYIRDLAKENYQKVFWNDNYGYLADYVDTQGQHMEVRPNMLFPVWLKNSPIDDFCASSVVNVISRELLTKRGLRTLSPRNSEYRGVYEGTQKERDLAYHQGSTRPYLLYPYVDTCFRMMGKAFVKKAEWLVEGFYDDLNKHGIGAFAEIYDGDPPHEAHGAISSAMSTAALLAVNYLIKQYK